MVVCRLKTCNNIQTVFGILIGIRRIHFFFGLRVDSRDGPSYGKIFPMPRFYFCPNGSEGDFGVAGVAATAPDEADLWGAFGVEGPPRLAQELFGPSNSFNISSIENKVTCSSSSGGYSRLTKALKFSTVSRIVCCKVFHWSMNYRICLA